jgi:hypothetical protein
MLQMPPQQSGPWLQTSPFWTQNEDALEHRPATHSFEQQSEFWPHALPDVLQDVLRALHVPPAQVPPQHSALVVQFWPSDVHAPGEHVPLTHETEQHWTEVVHGEPVASQLTGAPPRQLLLFGSHSPEQHSPSPAQCPPLAAHRLEPPKLASAAPEPEAPPHPLAATVANAITVSAATT